MGFLESLGRGSSTPPQTAGVTDVVTELKGIVSQLSALVQAIKGRVTSGTFTMTATATLVVPEPAVRSNSDIQISATNASAGALMGSNKSLYISAKTAGVSFTVTTASGVAAAGGETFSYLVNSPT